MLDRLVEGAAHLRFERVACRAELAAVQEETPVRPATADALVGRTDRLVAAFADGGQRGACALADRRIRHGATSDERSTFGPACGVRRAENHAAQAELDRCVGGAHGTIFSIGSTRMPDAPAAFSRGRRPHTSSEPTTEWIAIIPSCASGMTDGRLEPWQERFQLGELRRRGVHQQVFLAARRDDRAEHRIDRSQFRGTFAMRCRVRDEDRLGAQDVADRAEAVHHHRGAGRDKVDDGLGEPETRGDLDRAGDRDHIDRDRTRLEEPTRRVRMGGRNPQAGQVLDSLVGRIVRDRGREAALAVAEVADARQLRARLGQQVDAGDAEVRHAVAHELDDVVRAHEEYVEVVVLDARDEAAVVLVEHEARVVEEPKGRFDQPSLVRDGQPEAVSHCSTAVGYGRPPGCSALRRSSASW